MKNLIELAKQAGFQNFLKPADRPEMICAPAALEAFAALVRNEVMDECIKNLRNETPAYYVYRVNGLRWNSSAERPHEGDYDEGTLIPLYTQ